jgi:hypothetical protein
MRLYSLNASTLKKFYVLSVSTEEKTSAPQLSYIQLQESFWSPNIKGFILISVASSLEDSCSLRPGQDNIFPLLYTYFSDSFRTQLEDTIFMLCLRKSRKAPSTARIFQFSVITQVEERFSSIESMAQREHIDVGHLWIQHKAKLFSRYP